MDKRFGASSRPGPMNENHLVHIPSCSATNIVPNLFVRFCQRHERFERLELRELFGRWEKNWQRRKKEGPKSLNLEHGTLNMRVRDETGLIFELRKAKDKSSRALRKFRRLTIHPMLHSIIALTAS
jgi:intergrase/recombinase